MSDGFQGLMPPNATRLERRLDEGFARIGDVPVPIEPLWDVDACPEDRLPWLAWAVGVDYWRPGWPAEVKRNVIRSMLKTRATRGTPAAVHTALSALKTRISLREWFDPGVEGAPYTVLVDAYANDYADRGPDWTIDDLARDLTEILQRTAPARVHFDLRIGADFGAGPQIGGAMRRSTLVAHDLSTTPEPRGAVRVGQAVAARLTRPASLTHGTAAVPFRHLSAAAEPMHRIGAALTRPAVLVHNRSEVPLADIEAQVDLHLHPAAILRRPVVLATATAAAS